MTAIRTLGILAGSGALPGVLAAACRQQGITPFIIAFEGQTAPEMVHGHEHLWTRLGAAGQVIAALRAHDISDVVMIGGIRRPSLSELRPDLTAAGFFARQGLRALGDDGLLGALRIFLQEQGFAVHGVQDFVEELLAPPGVLGRIAPDAGDEETIRRGLTAARALGRLDIGQAVIVQQGMVLGVEAAEGTDELIRRCRHLQRTGRGGVLVKISKPQQDRMLDLPTIGPDTVALASQSGLAGIVIEAGRSLVVDAEKVAALADQYKIFVTAVEMMAEA